MIEFSLPIITFNIVFFAGGKFCKNVDQNVHMKVIFTISVLFPNQCHYGVIFAWEKFLRPCHNGEKRENYPHTKKKIPSLQYPLITCYRGVLVILLWLCLCLSPCV